MFVGEGRQRSRSAVASATRLEGPEHQEFLRMVPQDAGAVRAAILGAIGKRLTNRCARQNVVFGVLPLHGKRRQVPVVSAGNTGAIRVGGLMTGSTVQARHALAPRPAHYVEQMTAPVVALFGIARSRVAIDTARSCQHGIDLLPGRETRFTRC